MSKRVIMMPTIKEGDDSWENLRHMLDGFVIHYFGHKELNEQELVLWKKYEQKAVEHYKTEKGINLSFRKGTLWYGREEDFIS